MKLVELIDKIYTFKGWLTNSEVDPMYDAALRRAELLERLEEVVRINTDPVSPVATLSRTFLEIKEILAALKEEA